MGHPPPPPPALSPPPPHCPESSTAPAGSVGKCVMAPGKLVGPSLPGVTSSRKYSLPMLPPIAPFPTPIWPIVFHVFQADSGPPRAGPIRSSLLPTLGLPRKSANCLMDDRYTGAFWKRGAHAGTPRPYQRGVPPSRVPTPGCAVQSLVPWPLGEVITASAW